ncbi:MAG: SIS domain-containing protein [Candidatus Sumerlaeia bacterium]|nr:SIS domain-containing protein [Candidatus Sumerlaeia bacterium]
MQKNRLLQKAREVVACEARAVAALAEQFNDSLVKAARMLLGCKGHVLVIGSGTSHAIALRMAHLLSCCGTPALYVSATDCLHGGAGAITPRDVVYAISKGGTTDEINRTVQMARERGAKIVAHTEAPESPLAKMSDLVFCIKATDDADPYGMIATGSSLVNGAACDALCVLLLELRGYTKEQFGRTHPGGAVGRKLAAEGGKR